jgi:ATP-binding cassette, subfamily B, bacterial
MAEQGAERGSERRLSNLNMVWRIAGRYPGRIVCAVLALLTAAAATLAIPEGFRRVIDKGFTAHGGSIAGHFYMLLAIVTVLAVASAVRFYCVSWMGERVVADLRKAVQANGSPGKSAATGTALLRRESSV